QCSNCKTAARFTAYDVGRRHVHRGVSFLTFLCTERVLMLSEGSKGCQSRMLRDPSSIETNRGESLSRKENPRVDRGSGIPGLRNETRGTASYCSRAR